MTKRLPNPSPRGGGGKGNRGGGGRGSGGGGGGGSGGGWGGGRAVEGEGQLAERVRGKEGGNLIKYFKQSYI